MSNPKLFLTKILAVLSRAVLKRYKPLIIGVTGSVGKTSTREAIYAVLKKKYKVRRAEKNLNTEIGLPLAVLDAKYHHRRIGGWLLELLKILRRVVFGFDYPEVLILEYGVDKPGDMDYLLSIAKPHMAVVTAIGDIPVHVEFFQDPEELIAEKAKLVRALPADGYAILNHDDFAVLDMKDKTGAHTMTFGFEEHADVKIFNYQLSVTRDEKLRDVPGGISFKIEHGGDVVPFRLPNTFGAPQAYAAAAAAAVGLVINLNPVRSRARAFGAGPRDRGAAASGGMNLVEISEALREYVPPPGRLRLLKGIKNSFILDDTYNASPEAMRSALDTLKDLKGGRKIAVLGDMLEIGKYSEAAHRAIGDEAAKFVDILLCVGPRAKFIADEYKKHHTTKSAHVFDDSLAAGKYIDQIIRAGDLILVKGSQALRMEKTVEEIMAHPERAGELLVRQDEYWQETPTLPIE